MAAWTGVLRLERTTLFFRCPVPFSHGSFVTPFFSRLFFFSTSPLGHESPPFFYVPNFPFFPPKHSNFFSIFFHVCFDHSCPPLLPSVVPAPSERDFLLTIPLFGETFFSGPFLFLRGSQFILLFLQRYFFFFFSSKTPVVVRFLLCARPPPWGQTPPPSFFPRKARPSSFLRR